MVSSLLLALLMVLCFAPLASASADMAAAPPESTAQIVSKITYPVVSDTEQLIALARQQYYDDVRTQGKAAADAKEFTATELAGVTTYADGTVEMDYVSSAIAFFDHNGRKLSRRSSANPLEGDYANRDMYFLHKMYWTSRSLPGGYSYRITRITTVMTDIGTDPVYVRSFYHGINCHDSDVITGDHPGIVAGKTITNPVSGTTYTFTNPSSEYYLVHNNDILNTDYCTSGVSAIEFSNGNTTGDVILLDLNP